VNEFLMLKPVHVSSRDHRWVSSWCWSQYRCRHAYNRVSILPVNMMTSSCSPSPAHTTPDRSFHSSTSCMTSLVPTAALTSREQSVASTSATETLIPSSRSSSLSIYTYRQTISDNIGYLSTDIVVFWVVWARYILSLSSSSSDNVFCSNVNAWNRIMHQTSLDNISKLKCTYSTVQLLDAKVEQESKIVHLNAWRHISRQCLNCTYWRKPLKPDSNVSTLF